MNTTNIESLLLRIAQHLEGVENGLFELNQTLRAAQPQPKADPVCLICGAPLTPSNQEMWGPGEGCETCMGGAKEFR